MIGGKIFLLLLWKILNVHRKKWKSSFNKENSEKWSEVIARGKSRLLVFLELLCTSVLLKSRSPVFSALKKPQSWTFLSTENNERRTTNYSWLYYSIEKKRAFRWCINRLERCLLCKKTSQIVDADSTHKSDFWESIVSILDELEWSDFDRNLRTALQFTVMNTRIRFWWGDQFAVVKTPLLWSLFYRNGLSCRENTSLSFERLHASNGQRIDEKIEKDDQSWTSRLSTRIWISKKRDSYHFL